MFEEGIHFYYNEAGNMVLTATYLKERGYCCGNGCMHCPYDYINVPERARKLLLEKRSLKKNNEEEY